ncbi:MAG: DUF4440 domain-containing protein [Mangrovimonas sp.]|nr:DUF4440 domain-containing protein [Mangrovimonas sp.]
MKHFYLLFFLSFTAVAQYDFEPSSEFPFGRANPNAPEQVKDFQPMIGECHCKSETRKQDGSWNEPVDMTWTFKYIMNGWAVQDETLKVDGAHSGSIRQYIADSVKWYVHYYASKSPSTSLPTWEGTKKDNGKIVLYRDQKAPNGMDGFYRLTFYDMNESGYKWVGEWVSKDENVVYPTWKIDCEKNLSFDPKIEKAKILANNEAFSNAYIKGDFETIANSYTDNGKIFPNNTDIIRGREAIKARWSARNGYKVLHHEINPEEITFAGNYAYDYGYFKGKSQNESNGSVSEWKGKYVVIWKKIGADWKIYLDIWNQINE